MIYTKKAFKQKCAELWTTGDEDNYEKIGAEQETTNQEPPTVSQLQFMKRRRRQSYLSSDNNSLFSLLILEGEDKPPVEVALSSQRPAGFTE